MKIKKKREDLLLTMFADRFPENTAEKTWFSAPGRTEIGGNHTDHQHGHVLCGSVTLDMVACVAPNGTDTVRILSEGYPSFEVNLTQLEADISEYGTTKALVRGVAAGIAAQGYVLEGFDATIQSDIPAGAGLSSSAAFEVLIGTIFNHYCCGGTLSSVDIAKVSQMAERDYFGKPCGLMDQIGCATGGAVAVDFEDPANPVVNKVDYDFSQSGYALCIVDTHSDHADLTPDYAAIPAEMRQIANCFGEEYLRDVPEDDFRIDIPKLRKTCGDRAVLRALHFYNDDRMAQVEAKALEENDFSTFLYLVNTSGISSIQSLQNIWSPSHPRQQAVSLALALGRELLDGDGAIRVHGGGFAGTIQAFVPEGIADMFRHEIDAVFGKGSCHILHIRPEGACTVSVE